MTEVRARSRSCSGDSFVWPGRAEDGKRDALGDEGRRRGEPDGLTGRPPCEPWGENEVNAKLILPTGPSLFADDCEFMDALLPWRLCRLGGSSRSFWGTRTIVRRLVMERDEFRFTSLCVPHGSAAATDPLRADNLRGREFGPRTGLISGVERALMLNKCGWCGAARYVPMRI